MNRIAQKREREKRVVSEMIALYCRGNHGSKKGKLCPECEALSKYARDRSDKCPLCAQPRVCSLTGGSPVYPRPNQPDISESWDGASNDT